MKSLTNLDAYCIACFPELSDAFDASAIHEASQIGSYILHEDFLVPYVVKNRENQELLVRYANYIESLASSDENDSRDLAEVGLIENIIDKYLIEIAPLLGVASKKALLIVSKRMNVSPDFLRHANKS